MTTHGAPASDDAWSQGQGATPTLGWFLRRSVLWAAIVVAAVAMACGLYAVASKAQPTPATSTAQPA